MNFIGKIELCEKPEDKVAGRALIKMSALKISKDDLDDNDNGLNWVKQYVEENKKSLIGGAYKVRFVDDEKTYPSDHGDMIYDDDGNVIFPDTDSVGTIQDVYIEPATMDGENIEVLQTQGYIYTQSYPNFYKWLKDETNRGTVYGSIEINGKAGAKNIVYANESKNVDGSPKKGRKPQMFDFVSLAILSSFVPPADKYSRVVELNQKGEMMISNKSNEIKEVNPKETVEQNSLNGSLSVGELREILDLAVDEKIKTTSVNNSEEFYTWIRDIYPDTKKLIVEVCFKNNDKYYIADYQIENGIAIIGELSEVENTWVPTAVNLVDNIENQMKGETREMTMTELNQKLDANEVEINELTTKNKDLSEAVVKANKSLEETNTELNSVKVELEGCKKELEVLKAEKEEAEVAAELNQKKADAKNYFDTEIIKNGFAEEEINSLKVYVESGDLDGLKATESELCTKKFKEMKSTATTTVEVNSNNSELFCPTKPVTASTSNDNDGAELFK